MRVIKLLMINFASLALFSCHNCDKLHKEIQLYNEDYKLKDYDFDGDGRIDELYFDFTEGAHCCYMPRILISSSQKTYRYPFLMDGGYEFGVDLSRPNHFNIKDYDSDGLPEIFMEIYTYNHSKNDIPEDVKSVYGIRNNNIIIQYENGKLSVEDFPEYISTEQYFLTKTFSELPVTLIPKERNNKYCYMDEVGRIRILCQLDEADPFSKETALVKIAGKDFFIHTSGKIIRKFDEYTIFIERKFSENGLILAELPGGYLVFLNNEGKEEIVGDYVEARPFSEGLAAVRKKGEKWGYINSNNKWVIKPKFDNAFNFKDAKANVFLNGESIQIDNKGNRIIE